MINLGQTVWVVNYNNRGPAWKSHDVDEEVVEGIRTWRDVGCEYYLDDDYDPTDKDDIYVDLKKAQVECEKQNKEHYQDIISEAWRKVEQEIRAWGVRMTLKQKGAQPWYDSPAWKKAVA